MRRTIPTLLVTSAVAVLAAAAPAAGSGHALHGGLLRHTAGKGSSYNWSGYVQTGSSGTFSSASANWTVPTLKTTYDGYASTWVGIDGDTDSYLIQTGTEEDVIDGAARYYAWYEIITPQNEAPEVRYTNFTIHPGDSMSASVVKTSSKHWTLTVKDDTTGSVGTHSTANFAGPGASAEWIQEDTDVDGSISAAPDWQKATFTDADVNGSSAHLKYGQSLDIYDSIGTHEDDTGRPVGGDAFTITWLATGTPTPVG